MPARERPFVFVNVAMTADGKIASANREVTSLGSAQDHRHLYELRASADALMCGARTVSEPDVTMGTGGPRFERLRRRLGSRKDMLRVVVTGGARVRLQAPVFRDRSAPIIVLVSGRAPKTRLNRLRSVADELRSFGTERVDLKKALRWLFQEHRVRRLLCEGGAELNGSLLRAGLVDELHITLCPKILGGRGAPTLAEGDGFSRLADAARFRLHRARRIGDEVFLVYRPWKDALRES